MAAQQKENIAKKLEGSLQHRPDARTLEQQGKLESAHAAPAIQSAMAELDEQMKKDHLKKGLERRRRHSKEELHAQGILKTPVEVRAEELQKAKNADAVQKGIKHRDSREKLEGRGIVKTPVEVRAEALERQKNTDMVKKNMKRRSSIEDLKRQGIMKTPVQARSEALAKAKHAEALNKGIKNRPDQRELEQKGVLKMGEK
jgi:hypothetical protein